LGRAADVCGARSTWSELVWNPCVSAKLIVIPELRPQSVPDHVSRPWCPGVMFAVWSCCPDHVSQPWCPGVVFAWCPAAWSSSSSRSLLLQSASKGITQWSVDRGLSQPGGIRLTASASPISQAQPASQPASCPCQSSLPASAYRVFHFFAYWVGHQFVMESGKSASSGRPHAVPFWA
jgi:hypothetical protein